MRILIVRHGDPDYEIDSLTEKGWVEAGHLAERLASEKIDAFYVSPLGRAKDTASLTLKCTGRTVEEKEWLKEFPVRIYRPDRDDKKMIAWDWLPQDWTKDERFYSAEHWTEPEAMAEADTKAEYDRVCSEFDKLLAEHGYVRDGKLYRVERPNNDTICLFCHFGLECVLLSHLLNVSPMVLWHGFCAAPTSVTTVMTEERRKGIASFRVSAFGDVSHLYVHREEPSFSARFCECFDNEEERHD